MDGPQTIALVVDHIMVEDGGVGDSSHQQQGIGHTQILEIHLPHFPEVHQSWHHSQGKGSMYCTHISS